MQVDNLAQQVVGVDLVGQLSHGEHRAATSILFDGDHRAHGDQTATGAIGVVDATATGNQRAGGKIGALDALNQRLEQLLARRVRVLE